MSEFSVVWVTCANSDEAERIASGLVSDRVCACVNILPKVRSVYRWEGKIEKANEVMLVIKSRTALFDKIKDKVKSLHSYECPEVIQLPVTQGHKPYLDWVKENTVGL